MNRRDAFKFVFAVGALLSGRRGVRAAPPAPRALPAQPALPAPSALPATDYIVVGSGAGGGTVAARLVEEGFSVLVLEAGGDPGSLKGADPQSGGQNALPEDYEVPAFHALATENEGMKWDFWVRHYGDNERQRRDEKYRETWNGRRVDGVLYPRAATLGGCTAHNAMVLVYPHDSDWNELADLTGDPSWRAERMRPYFERLENCHHRPLERFWSKFGRNPSRHGWRGWLHTEKATPEAAFRDRNLLETILQSARAALREIGGPGGDRARLDSQADPNDARADGAVGVRYTPLTTRNHARVGTRERLLDVQQRFPNRLKIEMHALVTRVLFDASNRAIGVEYQKGERLYGAHAQPSGAAGVVQRAYAAREVVLAGGAFNTPQLLMLSGIGPRETLERHRIDVRVDLPGVGRNLQDRYEVAVVNRMAFDSWKALEGATFTRNDPHYREWANNRKGSYATNGALVSVVLRSSDGRPAPDLFCYSLVGYFRGYFPTYSTLVTRNPNCLTWVVLKGHTNNTAGEVTLRSGDPREPPAVNFRYFEEGNDPRGDDLDAVVEGVRFVRRLANRLKEQGLIAREEVPGDTIRDEDLADFVRNSAWGHHASCTCPIGRQDQGGVLSSDFAVHGTQGLRVADASVFPRIPGLFIVSAVYMVGEKAADVIIAKAKRG